MASLKEIAREYRDEIMDGIAWVAIWKTGRSWNAKAFWLNLETERIEDEEMEEAREIVAADPKAIFINEYYTAHMGEGKLDEIAEGIRFMYENEYNLLANNTAYAEGEQEGIRFEASEKMEEITTITKDMNQMDKNWKWSTKVEDRLNPPFPESVIEMHWGYLGYLEEPQDYFKVIYDQTEQVFVVKDCMAYDKEAESIGKMERAADQMAAAIIAGEDVHGFAEEYKKQKANRSRYRKVMEELDKRERRRAGRE